MADCHNLLAEFNKEISLSKTKKLSLRDAKTKLRKRISKYFKETHPDYTPNFYIQGSYKNGTIIRTKDDECDLDDGVFFLHKISVNSETLQGWVRNAVDGHTTTSPQHKKKCIRVIYKGDFHIDLPVFHFEEEIHDHPQLAVRYEGFTDDDPKEFVNWLKQNKTDQLVRVIKYLKAWGDHKGYEMPSGLAMTILAVDNYVSNDRDDIALLETLQGMQENLEDDFSCEMPTTPYEDLIDAARFSDTRKNQFLSALRNFVNDAEKAIEHEKQTEASKKWAKHLGNRFPIEKAKDQEPQQQKAAIRVNQNAKSA